MVSKRMSTNEDFFWERHRALKSCSFMPSRSYVLKVFLDLPHSKKSWDRYPRWWRLSWRRPNLTACCAYYEKSRPAVPTSRISTFPTRARPIGSNQTLRRRSPLSIEISCCDAGCRLNDSGTRKTHPRKSLCRKASALVRLQAALARNPHFLATAIELGELAASCNSGISYTDEERERYAFERTNPDHAKSIFNLMSSSLAWTEEIFFSAGLSILRSPIPLRSSTTPVLVLPVPETPTSLRCRFPAWFLSSASSRSTGQPSPAWCWETFVTLHLITRFV